ncbi:cytosine deaminase [Palleronia aestuarii]|uniref:Cytosine deaminase n=1 Tax=Palleronia aestuarii TaxID=568105 RepID=A0A2W7N8F8_9RHOB|nr:amidohydrolase family protein [Palleronia aestuarii]PZX15963.1 cytosine deaminase [Palleronia aestuarii]
MELIVRNVILAPGAAPVDLGVADGRIVEIAPRLATKAETKTLDGAGGYAFPGFVESHVHLDKACLLDRTQAGGDPKAAIAAVKEAKADFTRDDVAARAGRVLDMMIAQGTTLLRTQVEVDPVVGLTGLEGVMEAASARAWGIETEICVFPQDGLTNLPGTETLLREGLAAGATVLGACPYTDDDPMAQLDILFDMAVEHDVDLDMHLDFDLDPDLSTLHAVIERTEAASWQGRVVVGHVNRLSAVAREAREGMTDRLAAAGIGLTALPSTDLFLMGQGAEHLVPRGVAPVHAAKGCRCSLSTNNVLNPFTPFGDGSALRIAHLYAHVARIGDAEGLARCFSLVSEDARALMNRPALRIEPGAPADIVVLDAEGPADAVRRLAPARLGVKAGRQSFCRPSVRLLSPCSA